MKRYAPKKELADVQAGDMIRFIHPERFPSIVSGCDGVNLFKIIPSEQRGMFYAMAGGKHAFTFSPEDASLLEHVPPRIIETHADFEVGDRVYLRPKSDYSGVSPSNPTPDVIGTVYYADVYRTRVEWDNETHNGYSMNTGRGTSDGLPHLALVSLYDGSAPQVEPEDPTEDIEGILFGSDLELFVMDKELGKIIPAGLLVPGTKENPFKMSKGTVHPDGLAVEVGCPPASTMTELMDNLQAILDEVKQEFFPEEKYQWHDKSMVLDTEVQDFDKHKAENPEWFISGCAPELTHRFINSGTGYPIDVQRKDKRRCTNAFFCGFHIHYGFTEWENTPSVRIDAATLVKTATQNVRSTDADLGGERTDYYGGRGVFRVKPYGVEDRSLAGHVFLNNKAVAYKQAGAYQKLIKEALNV